MKELPEGWEWVKLGEVAELIMGQSPPGDTYNLIGQGAPFLQGKAEFGNVSPIHVKYTTKPLKIAPKDSILISVRAPVGDVNIADKEYCIGRGLGSISFREGDNNYLFYLLKYFKKALEKMGTGSTFKAINKSAIERFQIPHPFKNGKPDLEKQQKIVAILKKAEQTKHLHEQAEGLIDELLKSVFLDMFGEPGINPKGWDIVKLDSVSEKIQDGTHFSPKEQNHKGDFLYITAKNIRSWGFDLTDVMYIPKYIHEKIYKRCDPKKGDVIYIKDGVTAGLAKVNNLDAEFSMLSSLAMIRPNRSNLNPYFLEYYINHPNSYKRIMRRKSGSAITRMILREIKEIKIYLPPIHLQKKFAKIVERMENIRKKQESSKQETDTLFNALLQKAFTGELVT